MAPQLADNNIYAGPDAIPFFAQMNTSTPVPPSPASVCNAKQSETDLKNSSSPSSSPMLERDVLIPEVIYGESEELLNDANWAKSPSPNLSRTADDTEKSPPADEKYNGIHIPGSPSRTDYTRTALSQDKTDGDTGEEQEAKKQQFQVDLNEVLMYLKDGKYPFRLRGKGNLGKKKNFRRQCEAFHYENGKMYYKPVNRKLKKNVIETQVDLIQMREVIMDTTEQERLIKIFHEGTEDSSESTAMSSHKGRDRLVAALKERFYWQSMYSQAERYCQLCITCKTVNPASLKVSDCMQPVGVPTRHMAQIGIDLSQMPEIDGKKYIIVAIDYFTKWVEAEAISDKSMGTVARFLYTNVLCRHSCPETIITDQGRDDTEDDDPFDMEKFAETLRPMDKYREQIDKAVEGNIKKAQDRQRRGYNKRHSGGKILKAGDEVFLINQRRRDRKGGNYERPRSGPYIIVEISDRKNVTLKNSSGIILKTKYPLIDLEPYIVPPEREHKRVPRTEHDNSELSDSDVK
ncbi:Gypsy retrotransposon integrase-like protein 1, partial [Frankliniella fusca]